MYTENYDHESNKINIDKIIDNIDLETWDEDDFEDGRWELEDHELHDIEWDLNNEEI